MRSLQGAELGADLLPHAHLLTSATLGVRHRVTASALALEDGAAVVLRSEQSEASWAATFRVRAPAAVTLLRDGKATRQQPGWAMVRGVALRCERDVLAKGTRWFHHKVILPEERAVFTCGGEFDAVDQLRRFCAVLRAAATAAVARCDAAAHALAMRFRPHLRFRVYARIVGDPTGRIADLARACPGALIFACSLVELEDAPTGVAAGERLLADVVAGRRLDDALDDAVEGWRASIDEHVERAASQRGAAREEPAVSEEPEAPAEPGRIRVSGRGFIDETRDPAPWRAALEPAAWPAVRRAQRLLVRRAGPQVDTKALWLPPPLALVPEDIPTAARANGRWYRTMKLHQMTLSWLPDVDRGAQLALTRFLSRHAVRLAMGDRRQQRARMDELLDYLRDTRRWPTRASELDNVLRACARWHDAFGAGLERGRAERWATLGDRPLWSPRRPIAAAVPDVALAPIATTAALVAEGQAMQHCVATRALRALAGQVLVFSGRVHGERVTVELVWYPGSAGSGPGAPRERPGSWALGDVRLRRNALPSPLATAAIRAWADEVAAQLEADGERPAAPAWTPSDEQVPF